MVGDVEDWRVTVASDGLSFVGVARNTANPLTLPELSTSAHPTTLFAIAPVPISAMLFGCSAALTEVDVDVWVMPRCVKVTGRESGAPSSDLNRMETPTVVADVFTSVMAVSHQPPAATWASTPERPNDPTDTTVRLKVWDTV